MSLTPFSPIFRTHLDDMFHDINRWERSLPATRRLSQSNTQVVNDNRHFGVDLDVSHFKGRLRICDKSWCAVEMCRNRQSGAVHQLLAMIRNMKELRIEAELPEELKVSIEGHVLTIEGAHEIHDDDQYLKRSFVRKWALPEDCNLQELKSSITKDGHLFIDAPKTGEPTARQIAIEHSP